MSQHAEPLTVPDTGQKKRTRKRKKPLHIPQYHVVLLDDDEHTYDYVIEMLMQLFGHSRSTAFDMACEVDARGRVIVDTTTKERAELKRDQIHAYGPDWRIPYCQGSMSAIIEPAEKEA
ncbi:MAG: ATP-dependent Clp protease adaptor ClpS [Calditrichaeota bacterium]|nr:MAG: ATP-dependent Clp protease adaptor ClpS [Calditrichota bacterium]